MLLALYPIYEGLRQSVKSINFMWIQQILKAIYRHNNFLYLGVQNQVMKVAICISNGFKNNDAVKTRPMLLL